MMHRTAVAVLFATLVATPSSAQQRPEWQPDYPTGTLELGSYEYGVSTPAGQQTFVKTLERSGEAPAHFSYSTAMSLGGMEIVQTITFTEAFRPVSLIIEAPSANANMSFSEGRVTGSVNLPTGATPIDATLTPDAIGAGMDDLAIALTDLSKHEDFTLRISDGGELVAMGVEVETEETITVPAGTFDAYRLATTTPGGESLLWVTKAAPHRLLKQIKAGGAATIQLHEVRPAQDPE